MFNIEESYYEESGAYGFSNHHWFDSKPLSSPGGIPPSRWIVNYDFDLLDGLVIASVLGAHMPFLVS